MLRERPAIGTRDLAAGAMLAAMAFFINPPAGLATCAAWFAFACMRLTPGQAGRLTLLAGLAMAALIAPWAMRNQAVLGHPILLRSNFGLELAIANYDGALDPVSPRAAGMARINAVHQTRERFAAAGGEVAYSQRVGADAERWIAAHPLDFVRLSLRHYRQFYVPDTWAEDATNWNGANRVRIRILQIVGALGLVGLLACLWRGGLTYVPLGLYIAVARPALCRGPADPALRLYRLPAARLAGLSGNALHRRPGVWWGLEEAACDCVTAIALCPYASSVTRPIARDADDAA